MDKVQEAINFAYEAHKGAIRKGSVPVPYIYHPLEVATIVSTMTDDEDIIVGALLHDTVEDTPVTIEQVREKFGDKVAEYVDDDSEDKRIGTPKKDTWHQRKVEAIEKLKNTNNIGSQMISLADKISNLRSMRREYYSKGFELFNMFNEKDPQEHKWYYCQIAEVLSNLKEYPIYKEYIDLINDIWG